MTTMLNAVDFAFRPIRPEEDYSGMDCGDGEAGRCSAPAGAEVAGKFRDYGDSAGFDDDDLFISDGEKLPDVTGFGARQREINEQQRTGTVYVDGKKKVTADRNRDPAELGLKQWSGASGPTTWR